MTTFSPRTVTSSQPPRILNIIRATITISLLMFAALFLFGCASVPAPLDLAARTLTSTVQSVDKAMQGFTLADALGTVSTHDQIECRKLYTDYQAAEAVAEAAITTAIKTGDTGSLAATTAALNAASAPLLKFLARFTTSPPAPNWKTNLQSTSEVKPLPWENTMNPVLIYTQ